MLIGTLKETLAARTPAIGCWIQVASPTVAEIFSAAGFDWAAVDCEHSDIGLNELASILRGFRNTVPLVRVKQNDPLSIRQPLDCGAAGVIVPLIHSADEAKAAVRSALYPPDGIRGFAYCRANDHGMSFDEYVKNANAQTVVIAMIESESAVECIDEILAVDGLDGVFIGPYDLSGSLGVTGKTDHPKVLEALDRVCAACARAGKAAGQHIVRPDAETVQRALSTGYTFLALGVDTVFLSEGSRTSLAFIDGVG